MKWRTPDPGEERGGWAFAFLPTECEEGVTVWLQWFWRVQRYQSVRAHGLQVWGWVWNRAYAYKTLTDQAQAMASEGREARRVYKAPPTFDDEPGFRVVLPCLACGAGVHVRLPEPSDHSHLHAAVEQYRRSASDDAACGRCGHKVHVSVSAVKWREA